MLVNSFSVANPFCIFHPSGHNPLKYVCFTHLINAEVDPEGIAQGHTGRTARLGSGSSVLRPGPGCSLCDHDHEPSTTAVSQPPEA